MVTKKDLFNELIKLLKEIYKFDNKNISYKNLRKTVSESKEKLKEVLEEKSK